MRKREVIPEYEVAGSKKLSFESHPAASLQHLAGGMVPPHSVPSTGCLKLQDVRDALSSPVDLCASLAGKLAELRQSVDDWVKSSRRVLKNGGVKASAGTVAGIESVREQLETCAVDASMLLAAAHIRIQECIGAAVGEPFRISLGLPSPVTDNMITKAVTEWRTALKAAGAFDIPQDDDLAQFFARTDYLVDEIQESLREIGREAKWLWTHEPTPERTRTLLEWMFDLRCECLEIAPTLACLR